MNKGYRLIFFINFVNKRFTTTKQAFAGGHLHQHRAVHLRHPGRELQRPPAQGSERVYQRGGVIITLQSGGITIRPGGIRQRLQCDPVHGRGPGKA